VQQDPALTLAEAATLLKPEIGERALYDIVRALPRIRPCGRRWTGNMGRPADLYDWAELTRLHQAIAPWLDASHTSPKNVASDSTP
jgi:hypothetical protein